MYQERITRSSLGRLGFIGELYDVRTESFSCQSLFKSTLPQNLIERRDLNQMEFEYRFIENISDRFEMMNVEAELQLNVLLGILNVEGSGKFLSEEKKSQNSTSCTLICKILRVCEKLFASFDEILPYINLQSLKDPQNTHVIVEINWGANCLLSLESTCCSSYEKKKFEGELSGKLEKLKKILSVKGSGGFEKEDNTSFNNNNIHIKICADAVSEKFWPTTIEGFCDFVAEVPELLKQVNNGKGKPLNYAMIPLSTIFKLANLELKFDAVVRKIDESFLVSIIYFFEEILEKKLRFYDVLEKMKAYKKYVAGDTLTITRKKLEELLIKESQLKSLISEDWVAVKSGEKTLKELVRKIEKFKNQELNLFSYEDFLESCNPILNKISLVNNYISKGVTYLGKGENFHDVLTANLSSEFVVLLISSAIEETDPKLYNDTCYYFLSLAAESQPNTKYVVVDFDFNGDSRFLNSEIKTAKCYNLKGNKILSSDLYRNYSEESEMNFAKLEPSSAVEYVTHKPGNRTVLEIRCPGFEKGSCTPDPLKWFCFRCKNNLEYGFDKYFYCSCGKGPVYSFQFRCKNSKHGSSFISFSPNIFENVLSSLRPLKELNLLLLGQSGVGKSTWINSIVNYLTYETLDFARENGVITTIPMSFVLYDPKTSKKHVVNVGTESKNEHVNVGVSGTQYAHTYSFIWEDRCIRIIDTPGLGDTRGIDQDKENLKNIIQHIGYLKELHGVCILFKADVCRITAYFSYCLKELFANLHKSVARNIVFCFTNARNSLYTPGQTSAVLEKIIDGLGVKDLELGSHNMYCLDNESLRFLCSLQNPEIHYDETIIASFKKSWEISLNETKRLFNAVKSFEPHLLKETVSLVTSRNRILTLTKPLSEISKTIQMNVTSLKSKEKELCNSELTIEELSKKLNFTEIVLEAVPLEKPRTVCTSPSCVEYIYCKSLDVREIDYKTHCHRECYLDNVEPKTVNNAELRRCAAMGSNGYCEICGCGWEHHMHLTFSQKRVEKNFVDKKVEEDMMKEKTQKKKIESFVNNLKSTIQKYEEEQKSIIQTCVKFGKFLQNNAISLYNDSVEDYLSYLIKVEESKLNRSEAEELLLQKLKDTLCYYKTEIEILNNLLKKEDNQKEELTVQDVYNLELALYDLELTGKDIKKAVELSRLAAEKLKEYAETSIHLFKNNNNNYLPSKSSWIVSKCKNIKDKIF